MNIINLKIKSLIIITKIKRNPTLNDIDNLINLIITIENLSNKNNRTLSLIYKIYQSTNEIKNINILEYLKVLIEQHQTKKDIDYRNIAYYIYGKVLENNPNSNNIDYYISLLEKEENKNALATILDSLEYVKIPENISPTIIIQYSKDSNYWVKTNAIKALGSFSSKEAKNTLKDIINMKEDKANKDEILYAIVAYNKLATKKDIDIIKKHTNSKYKNIREAALYLIEHIK